MSTKWPETVPVLTAKDFCRGQYTSGQCHCLSGWVAVVFGSLDHPAITAIWETMKARGIRMAIPDFNDRLTTPLEVLADVWNAAMKSLGYVVVFEA